MNKKGFTLIELLVVIAIIGLLSTIAVVALNSARAKSRDAKRIGDIKQIQTALELAFAETNAYPTATSTTLGTGNALVLCNNNGPVFQANDTGCSTVFMANIPSNPPPNGADYVYTGDGTTYSITFRLETKIGSLNAGPVVATPNGMKNQQ